MTPSLDASSSSPSGMLGSSRSRFWLDGRRWPALLLVAFLISCCVLAAHAARKMGQDANWDLANYHYYTPYALLNGRLMVDGAASGIQTYLNPLPYLPYYFLVEVLSARSASMLIGAVH